MPPYLAVFLPSPGDDPWLVVLKVICLTSIIAVIVFKGTDRVPAGQLALRLRMGKEVYHRWGPNKGQVVILGPGWHPLIPFFHTLWKTSVLIRMLPLEEQTRRFTDRVETVRGSIIFVVSDIKLGLLVGDDVNGLIQLMCSAKFCELVNQDLPYQEIPQKLLSSPELNSSAASLGVRLLDMKIPYWGETGNSQTASLLVAGILKNPEIAMKIAGLMRPSIGIGGNGHHDLAETS